MISNMQPAPTIAAALLPDSSSKEKPAPALDLPSTKTSTAERLQETTPAAWISPTSIIIEIKTPTKVVTPLPTEPVTANTPFTQETTTPTQPPDRTWDAGDIRKSPFDGALIVFIPAGKFTQGSSNADSAAQSNEKPQHSVTINAYWIDLNKVTNKMYRQCELDHGCSTPQKLSWPVLGDAKGYYNNRAFDDYPVINVNWDQANAYCSWAGRRLPTEAEWEKAARGTDSRLYPWGNEEPADKYLNFANHVSHTNRVGLYHDGASPYGVLEMSGNTFEWVADAYDAQYYSFSPPVNPTGPINAGSDTRVIRGVSWGVDNHQARVASRAGKWKLSFDEQTGFRCAANNNIRVDLPTSTLIPDILVFQPAILPKLESI
ncbi:MAG: SUMF1/EgtB/PvdO family nonheme iron enzyme [Anaerolineaceae bacterium]|nr:SUMF1/EgtB/PvdO family nonheme iron enzyme [Anaerolineaceae bacterium]